MPIVGFGAQQLAAAPQISQAPPALLFGTPNARVVPVQQTSNGFLPLNLTLQAVSTAGAIERIALSASLAGLSSAAPPPSPATAAVSASILAPANPSLVQQLASTVQTLLIGKVYSAPVFSFFA